MSLRLYEREAVPVDSGEMSVVCFSINVSLTASGIVFHYENTKLPVTSVLCKLGAGTT